MTKFLVELGRFGSILLITVVGLFVSLFVTWGVVEVMNEGGDNVSLQLSLQVAAIVTIVGSLTLGAFLTNLLIKTHELQEEMKHLATFDTLTGLLNRRVFMERVNHLFNVAIREEESFSIVIIDIDHFKAINDTYGHTVGDRALTAFGKLLRSSLRKSDLACRYGGEEFALFLPNTDTKQAREISERIHQLARANGLAHDKDVIRPTLSIGIVSFPQERAAAAEGLVNMADRALYHAKKTGRNRTVCYVEGI